MTKLKLLSLIPIAIIVLAPSMSRSDIDPFDPEVYCAAKEGGCRKGDSLQGPPRVSEPWQPFDSKDPLVWAADVCLGYFLTRSETAFSSGIVSAGRHHDKSLYLDVAREDLATRAYFFDFPFGDFGVFQCRGTLLADGAPSAVEFLRWTQTRILESEGWVSDVSLPGFEVSAFRNKDLGVRFRVLEIAGEFTFELEADYFGPPIIMD